MLKEWNLNAFQKLLDYTLRGTTFNGRSKLGQLIQQRYGTDQKPQTLTLMMIMMTVLDGVRPGRLVKSYQSFEGTRRLHFQDSKTPLH